MNCQKVRNTLRSEFSKLSERAKCLEHWNWIVETNAIDKSEFPYFRIFGRPTSDCYACSSAGNYDLRKINCLKCPVTWLDDQEDYIFINNEIESSPPCCYAGYNDDPAMENYLYPAVYSLWEDAETDEQRFELAKEVLFLIEESWLSNLEPTNI